MTESALPAGFIIYRQHQGHLKIGGPALGGLLLLKSLGRRDATGGQHP